ncbi:DUF637 domain-containing protein, partial [Variovorax sp. JS1663]|uniref:DUF637 domain-containing protein n=1 Tax=Variovorax sp. JS1663 TaxID=1851577 RepID=UPI00117E7928
MLPGLDAASGVKLAAVTLDRVAGLYVTNPGGSLLATAGRDMNLTGAEVKSGGDASLSAVRDLNLDSVTTGRAEDIRWSGRNSREGQQSREIGTTVSGAGSVSLTAGRDLTGRAATLSAGEALSLEATNQLTLQAGENGSSAETHHATKRGMTKYSLDADSQDTTLARTSLTGKNIQLQSGGDMTLSAIDAKAQSLAIDAGGQLNLLTQSTTRAMSAREVDNDAAFSSSSGSGKKDETSQYNRFDVKDLNIQAGGGVKAQLGQSDSLAALAQQPGMAWVNRLANDPAFVNSLEWQRVKEEHERWSYHQSGMGPVTALVVSVVAAAVAAPMAAQAGAAAGGAAAVATGEGVALTSGGIFIGASAPITASVSAAVQVGVTALASRAAVSLVNNDGELGKVLKEMGSSESIKAIATSMLTAGVIEGLGNTITMDVDGVATPLNQITPRAGIVPNLGRHVINASARAIVDTAINGGSLEDNLARGIINGVISAGAASGAYEIGQLTSPGIDPITGALTPPALNRLAGEVAHAIVGCAAGAARTGNGDGCAPGAVGAVVGHLTAGLIDSTGDPSRAMDTLAWSRLLGAIAGGIVGGDVKALDIAGETAGNAVRNNRMLHPDERATARRLAEQSGGRYTPEQIEEQMRLMGNKTQGVSANTLAQWDVATQSGYNIDPGLPTQAVPGTTQVIEVPAQVNGEIQHYIISSTTTGGGTDGIPYWTPYTTSSGATSSPSYRGPDAATAPCANGNHGCISGVGVQQNAPLTPQQKQAVGAYFGKMSTDYQRAAAMATATGNVPVTLSFEIAAGVAGLLEQAFTPSAGKVVIDSLLVDEVVKRFSTRTGIPLIAVVEVAEREIKPRLQNARVKLTPFHGRHTVHISGVPNAQIKAAVS